MTCPVYIESHAGAGRSERESHVLTAHGGGERSYQVGGLFVGFHQGGAECFFTGELRQCGVSHFAVYITHGGVEEASEAAFAGVLIGGEFGAIFFLPSEDGALAVDYAVLSGEVKAGAAGGNLQVALGSVDVAVVIAGAGVERQGFDGEVVAREVESVEVVFERQVNRGEVVVAHVDVSSQGHVGYVDKLELVAGDVEIAHVVEVFLFEFGEAVVGQTEFIDSEGGIEGEIRNLVVGQADNVEQVLGVHFVDTGEVHFGELVAGEVEALQAAVVSEVNRREITFVGNEDLEFGGLGYVECVHGHAVCFESGEHIVAFGVDGDFAVAGTSTGADGGNIAAGDSEGHEGAVAEVHVNGAGILIRSTGYTQAECDFSAGGYGSGERHASGGLAHALGGLNHEAFGAVVTVGESAVGESEVHGVGAFFEHGDASVVVGVVVGRELF